MNFHTCSFALGSNCLVDVLQPCKCTECVLSVHVLNAHHYAIQACKWLFSFHPSLYLFRENVLKFVFSGGFCILKSTLEANHTKIKGGCQSGRKVVLHDSKSDLPLAASYLIYDVQDFLNNYFSCFFGVFLACRIKIPCRRDATSFTRV